MVHSNQKNLRLPAASPCCGTPAATAPAAASHPPHPKRTPLPLHLQQPPARPSITADIRGGMQRVGMHSGGGAAAAEAEADANVAGAGLLAHTAWGGACRRGGCS